MFSVLRGVYPAHQNFRAKRIFVLSRGFPIRSIKNTTRLPTAALKFGSRYDIPAKTRTIQYREFRTSERRDIPPLFALLLKPVLRVTSLVFGRALRKWWRKKSPSERERYVAWFQKKRSILYGIFGAFFGTLLIYYLAHIERTPITNRPRFIMFTRKQQEFFEKLTFETHLEQHKDHILPESHPVYKQLLTVTDWILNSNKDLEDVREKQWTLTIVDLPLRNAYVLPGGNMFIFTGILQMVENTDQLSFVIAHEMAHAVLRHSIEAVSKGLIIDILLVVPVMMIWALFPDVVAIILQFFGLGFFNILYDLPYSRKLETEADEVGLTLAAKACVDVREAAVFWGLMRSLQDLGAEPEEMPWLSTHPNHKDREKMLNREMSKAIALRNDHRCPALKPMDPRKQFYKRSAKEIEAGFKQRGVL